MNAREPLYAVWDDLLQESTSFHRYVVIITGGAHLDLVGRLSADELIAVAPRTGQRYLIVRTGRRKRWGWATSVRVIPAVDTGDAAGTLVFHRDTGYPGHVNAEVWA